MIGRQKYWRWLVIVGAVLLGAAIAYVTAVIWSTMRSVSFAGQASSVEQVLEGWAALEGVPGAVLRVDVAGETRVSQAVGFLSNKQQQPLRPESAFHIASIGKLLTAATVLRLSEQSRLDLDAPVADYLGQDFLQGLVVVDGVDRGQAITARQLLTHRAGLGNTDDHWLFQARVLLDDDRVWTPATLLAIAREVEPAGLPGERSAYASPGYWLLGLLIEAVTQQPYHQAVREVVLQPLGMDNTFESSQEWAGQQATLHHYAGWIDLTEHHPSFEFADGGFVSTAADLARFGRAVIQGELFDLPETQATFLAPWPGEERSGIVQAHGPLVIQSEEHPKVVMHQGYWGTALILEPEIERVTVIALGQSNASTWQFWRQLRDLLANGESFKR
jgi:D-alanyl-D-alanine carboxypeptidase